MRFFKPTIPYLEWLRGYTDGRVVVELGCGDGFFTRAMRWFGIKAVGLDPFKEPEYLDHASFVPMAASQFGLGTDRPALLIAARPDHSGWVTNVPYTMHRDSELLYIGLPRNIDRDLFNIDFTEIETPEVRMHVTLSIRKCVGNPPNIEIGSLLNAVY